MTEGSKLIVYLLFAITGSILFVLLFSSGPLGWFLIAFPIIAVMIVNAGKGLWTAAQTGRTGRAAERRTHPTGRRVSTAAIRSGWSGKPYTSSNSAGSNDDCHDVFSHRGVCHRFSACYVGVPSSNVGQLYDGVEAS